MRYILKDVRQWKVRYDLLRFGILLLVIVLFWVGLELYNTYSTTTIPEDYTEEIEPLNPTIDLEMIQEIESRVEVSENFEILAIREDEEDVVETNPRVNNLIDEDEVPVSTSSARSGL